MSHVPYIGVCARNGKAQYRSRKLALQAFALARQSDIWKNPNGDGGVYKCPACRHWHITSQTQLHR